MGAARDSSKPSAADKVPLNELVAQPAPILDTGGASPATGPSLPPPTRRPARPPKPTRSANEQSEDKDRAKAATQRLKLNNKSKQVEIDDRKGRIARDKEDHRLMWLFRKVLAVAGLFIVAVWQFAVFVIVVCQGFGWFKLQDQVVIALLSTTTANVIGLILIVFKFAFAPSRPPDRVERKSQPR